MTPQIGQSRCRYISRALAPFRTIRPDNETIRHCVFQLHRQSRTPCGNLRQPQIQPFEKINANAHSCIQIKPDAGITHGPKKRSAKRRQKQARGMDPKLSPRNLRPTIGLNLKNYQTGPFLRPPDGTNFGAAKRRHSI